MEAQNAEYRMHVKALWNPTTQPPPLLSNNCQDPHLDAPDRIPPSRSQPRQTSRHRQNPNPWEEAVPHARHTISLSAAGTRHRRRIYYSPKGTLESHPQDPARISLFVTYTPFGFDWICCGGVGPKDWQFGRHLFTAPSSNQLNAPMHRASIASTSSQPRL